MRRHEIELITALAEGTLEDETEARALIESSDNARSEYEAQKTAHDALTAVPRAEMTETEKAALHRDVWTALTASTVDTRKPSPWYYRWSYAAAGLFVVVGLVAVLNTGGLSGDDASTERLGSSQDSGVDDTISAAEADEAGSEAPALANDGAGDFESAVVNVFNRQASRVRSGQFKTATASAGNEQDSAVADYSACISSAGLDDFEALGETTIPDAESVGLDPDISYLVAVPEGAEIDDTTPVAFIELLNCVLVQLDE